MYVTSQLSTARQPFKLLAKSEQVKKDCDGEQAKGAWHGLGGMQRAFSERHLTKSKHTTADDVCAKLNLCATNTHITRLQMWMRAVRHAPPVHDRHADKRVQGFGQAAPAGASADGEPCAKSAAAAWSASTCSWDSCMVTCSATYMRVQV